MLVTIKAIINKKGKPRPTTKFVPSISIFANAGAKSSVSTKSKIVLYKVSVYQISNATNLAKVTSNPKALLGCYRLKREV